MTPNILFNVIIKNRSAVVNSRDVAKVFHKRHKNILRDIDRLKNDWSNFTQLKSEPSKTLTPKLSPADSETLNHVSKMQFDDCFYQSTYITKDGRTVRSFDMNRDGFTLLTMGFNDRDALAFKLAYINRFNSMEQELTKRNTLYDMEKQLRKQLTDTIQLHYIGDHLNREIMQLTNLLYIAVTGYNAAKAKRDRGFDKNVSVFAEVLTADERQDYIKTESRLIGLYSAGVTDYHELKAQLTSTQAIAN